MFTEYEAQVLQRQPAANANVRSLKAASVREAGQGKTVAANSPLLESVVLEPESEARPLHLTPRQLQVLSLLCQGFSNKLIGRQLNISAATVKVHMGCILRELGALNRLQAVVTAQRWALVPEASADMPELGNTPRSNTLGFERARSASGLRAA
jgi:DNA-binding NarL/FixJ family response regulator